jgi:hypothetical protein
LNKPDKFFLSSRFFSFHPRVSTFRKGGSFFDLWLRQRIFAILHISFCSQNVMKLYDRGTCREIFTRDFELKLRFQIFLRLCFMSNKFPNGAPAIFPFQHETGKFMAFCFYSFQVFCKNFSLSFRAPLNPKNVYRIMTFTFIALLKKC